MRSDTKNILKYVSEDGDEVEFFPESFKPFTYTEITGEYERYPVEIKAKPRQVKLNGKIIDKSYTINFDIDFNEDVSIYILEIGGWLPLSFTNHPNLVPDRNVISVLEQIKNKKFKQNTKCIDWWLSFHKNSSLMINPLLYAFEGKYRRFPAFNEFKTSFDKATLEIREYFPNAKIVSYHNESTYRKVYNLLSEISEKNATEEEFLLKTAPLVAQRPSDNEIYQLQDTIDDIAKELNILGESLVYYLVISCLYDSKDGSGYLPARKVLKPKQNFSKENAYNAIADMNALILFIQSLSLTDIVLPICTCDKPLAAFWSAINPIKRTVKNKKITVDFQFNQYLLPRLTQDEIINFANQLNEKKF